MIARALAFVMSRLPDAWLNDVVDELRQVDQSRLFAAIAGRWRLRHGAYCAQLRANALLAVVESAFGSSSSPLLEDVSARVVSCPRGRN